MSNLTLKDLQLIEAVSETGTLTAATQRLNITQSAVSQRLSNLQTRLNMTLVERRDGAMLLTPAGERILAAALAVRDELRSALNDVNALESQRHEQFHFATQCYTCYRWLPFVIRAMRDAYPLLRVDVVPDATEAPYAAIAKQKIDVAIVSNPDPDSTLTEVELFDDELFAVMHESHPLASRRYLSAKSFSGQALIVYTGKKHAIVEEILRPASVSDYSLVQVRITEAIIELARAGQGIAVISGWALDDMPDTDDLVAMRITRNGFTRTWRAVFDETDDEASDAAHRDQFIRGVKRIGMALGTRQWRKKLRNHRA